MKFINPLWLKAAQVVDVNGEHKGFISEVFTDGSVTVLRKGVPTTLSRSTVESYVANKQIKKSNAVHKQFIKTNPYK